jgi:hypothetical protein
MLLVNKNNPHLIISNWALVSLPKLLNSTRVISEIILDAYEDDGHSRAEVHHLRNPLARRRRQ